MSLDVYLTKTQPVEVFGANITHNLNGMAEVADLYEWLWQPGRKGVVRARHLLEPLTKGLAKLKGDPERFRAMNPENGWGDYEGLVDFVERYLAACKEHPDALVSVSR